MLKVCTVNVGTMKGKGREITSMLARRGADICCVQEVRYRGGSAMSVGDGDEKFKFWYGGNDAGTNGVGIFASQRLAENVIEVNRCSDRMMKVKIVLGKTVYHVYSVYAPQVGRSTREKEEFLEELEEEIAAVPGSEGLIIAGDFNCHVGTDRAGYEEVMGPYGYGTANPEGVALLDLCKNQGLKIANTCFEKDTEKLITYKSGSAATQIDYIIIKPFTGQSLTNCKVIPGEACVSQHRLLRADIKIADFHKKSWKGSRKLKLWKLEDPSLRMEFEERVGEGMSWGEGEREWALLETVVREAAEQTCGRTSGRRGVQRETWWWNETVQSAIRNKAMAFKSWQRTRSVQDHLLYRVANNRAKRAVTAAKRLAWSSWSENLGTAEGKLKMFKIAKQLKNEKKDIVGSNFIKDVDGSIKVNGKEAANRWRDYFRELLNVENSNLIEEEYAVQGPLPQVQREELETALAGMKSGKAAGPSEVTSDMLRLAGDTGKEMLLEIFQKILREEKSPKEWCNSLTIPLFKGKGDALLCDKYRGLRLLEHGMKIWERILLNRLKLHVKVDAQQCGFTSGKSTTDAIFTLRQLQEKYSRKKKRLYHIFVDLEKAFDKVPRAAIQWALRRQLVPERLINQVMSLYKHSASQVRFAGEVSGSFPVRVGVHQGSSLSPLLFNIVMEEATKSCRKGHPWELLYADDLVLTAESRDMVVDMFKRWRSAMERRGLKVNLAKTKLMVTGKDSEIIQTGRYPCGVCGSGVGVNSILCTVCDKWCHKRCSGLSSLGRVTDFRCPACTQGTSFPHTDDSVTVDGGVIQEVAHFCYLGDVLERSGGSERAIRARISAGWSKWRELTGLLTNCGIPLVHRGRVYEACVRPVLLYASETWAVTKKLEDIMLRADRRMLRFMAGVRLRDGVPSAEVLERCGLESIIMQMRRRRLRWFGHVVRREEEEPIGNAYRMEIPGRQPRGRPRKTWRGSVDDILVPAGVSGETMALDRERWSSVVKSLTSSHEGNHRL